MECSDCCTFIRQIDYKHHCLKICSKRQVACPNSLHGCTSFVRFDERLVHISLHCQFREVNCRLGCGMTMRCYKREDHEAVHCKQREIKCDQCQQLIRSYQITDHLHNKCPNRTMKCSVGCGASFLAMYIEDHEQNKCTMPCRWGCGQALGPIGNRRHHETAMCPSRPVSCANVGCSIVGLTAKFHDEHQKLQCAFRYVIIKAYYFNGKFRIVFLVGCKYAPVAVVLVFHGKTWSRTMILGMAIVSKFSFIFLIFVDKK